MTSHLHDSDATVASALCRVYGITLRARCAVQCHASYLSITIASSWGCLSAQMSKLVAPTLLR
jgi:hypothetical protein